MRSGLSLLVLTKKQERLEEKKGSESTMHPASSRGACRLKTSNRQCRCRSLKTPWLGLKLNPLPASGATFPWLVLCNSSTACVIAIGSSGEHRWRGHREQAHHDGTRLRPPTPSPSETDSCTHR